MRDARMAQEPSKESQIIEELLRKLDAERQKVSRLESELSEYKAPDQMRKAYEAKLKWKILCKLSHFVRRLKPTLGIAAK